MSDRRAGEQKSSAMRVKLKYPDVETFLAKYGPNISRGGIFIATKTPRPVGTAIRFDFVLVHDGREESVLRGEGSVHFVREADPAAPVRAPGMGVRFTRLLDDGEALIDRALRMRGPQADPPSAPDLPRGVREITGEFELATAPILLLDPAQDEALPSPRELPSSPEPRRVSASDAPDLDELARESGVSAKQVEAVLGRRGGRGIDADRAIAELESLLEGTIPEPTSAGEAAQRLDALLSRRRR